MKEEQVMNGTIQGTKESSGKVKVHVQKVVMSRSRRRDQRMGSMASTNNMGMPESINRYGVFALRKTLERAVSPLTSLTDN